jgi:protein phosphatase
MSVLEPIENHRQVPDPAGIASEEGVASPAVTQLATAGRTDPGQVRPLNEDSWQIADESETSRFWEQRGRLLIVADGMGGHAAGEVASSLAVETLYQHYYDQDDVPLPPAIRLERAVIEANLSVYEQAVTVDAQSGMGTTLVAAVVHEGRVLIANVGDSRAYLIREGQATQITDDHSWVAEQVKLGTITEEQAQTHTYRNLVTRCLGHRPGMQVDIFEHRLRVGDVVLLCSDGLSNQVSDAELANVLTEHAPEQAVQMLVDMANEKGGPDNITAVVAQVLELPAWLADLEPGAERPERLASKTTQPVRLEREQIEVAAERAARMAAAGTRRGLPSWLRLPASPRRRAALLLTVIALVILLAAAVLIALRANKITRWLAWPEPVPQLAPLEQGTWPTQGSVLVRVPRVQVWPCAASP